MSRSGFVGWALLSVLLASGCCVNRPYGPVDPCYPEGPGLRPGQTGCRSCGGHYEQQGPLATWCRNVLTCGSGCGQVYLDEWLSDPPECCDPCDDCGNYVGGQACYRRTPGRDFLGLLWGCRGDVCRAGEDCPPVGCTDCGGSGCDRCGVVGASYESDEWSDAGDEPPAVPQTSTAPDPKANRAVRPHQPSYTRPAVMYR